MPENDSAPGANRGALQGSDPAEDAGHDTETPWSIADDGSDDDTRTDTSTAGGSNLHVPDPLEMTGLYPHRPQIYVKLTVAGNALSMRCLCGGWEKTSNGEVVERDVQEYAMHFAETYRQPFRPVPEALIGKPVPKPEDWYEQNQRPVEDLPMLWYCQGCKREFPVNRNQLEPHPHNNCTCDTVNEWVIAGRASAWRCPDHPKQPLRAGLNTEGLSRPVCIPCGHAIIEPWDTLYHETEVIIHAAAEEE